MSFKMLNNPSLSLLYNYANIFAIGFEKTHPIIAHIDLANNSIRSSKCCDSTSYNIVK